MHAYIKLTITWNSNLAKKQEDIMKQRTVEVSRGHITRQTENVTVVTCKQIKVENNGW